MSSFNPRSSNAPSSSIAFPRFDSASTSEVIPRYPSTVSLAPTGRFSINRASALELHDLIYGSGTALSLSNSEGARAALDKLYERDAIYSNPLLTASSGDVIKDIHALMHQFTALSVPTPLSLFGRFFGGSRYQWLAIAKVWSEVGEVLESDVFDGHRRVVIEHRVYVLLLPNFFPPEAVPNPDTLTLPSSTSSLSENITGSNTPNAAFATSYRPTLGNVARMLTTLARQISLPVHTRLSFNDSGRITHHQDIWDVKDVMNLVPGVGVAQWIGSRLMARGLSTAFGMYEWASSKSGATGRDGGDQLKREGEETPRGYLPSNASLGTGIDPASLSPSYIGRTSLGSSANSLGLQLSERLAQSRNRAPDTDNDG